MLTSLVMTPFPIYEFLILMLSSLLSIKGAKNTQKYSANLKKTKTKTKTKNLQLYCRPKTIKIVFKKKTLRFKMPLTAVFVCVTSPP